METEILTEAVAGAIRLASLLTRQALSSGAMTQEQVDALLADAQNDWSAQWARWKGVAAEPPAS